MKKPFFKLEDARHRRKSFWTIRLYLMAILQHAKAWVAELLKSKEDSGGPAVLETLLLFTPQAA